MGIIGYNVFETRITNVLKAWFINNGRMTTKALSNPKCIEI